MGISGFMAWLQSEFPECFTVYDQNGRSPQAYDTVYYDMNAFVHNSVRTGKSQGHVLKKLFQQIDKTLRFANPTRRAVLALDGPGPVAKIKVQKARRAASVKKGKKNGQAFSSDQITPGTLFMLEVEEALYHFACERLHGRWGNVEFVVSGTTVPGEGEVKIFEYISAAASQRQSTNQKAHDLVVGCDADLILLALATGTPDLSLLLLQTPNAYLFHTPTFLNLLQKQLPGSPCDRVCNDFVMLMLLQGNDYIYKFKGAAAKRLWRAYKDTRTRHPDQVAAGDWFLITPDGDINSVFFAQLLKHMYGRMGFYPDVQFQEENQEEEEEEEEDGDEGDEGDEGEPEDGEEEIAIDNEGEPEISNVGGLQGDMLLGGHVQVEEELGLGEVIVAFGPPGIVGSGEITVQNMECESRRSSAVGMAMGGDGHLVVGTEGGVEGDVEMGEGDTYADSGAGRESRKRPASPDIPQRERKRSREDIHREPHPQEDHAGVDDMPTNDPVARAAMERGAKAWADKWSIKQKPYDCERVSPGAQLMMGYLEGLAGQPIKYEGMTSTQPALPFECALLLLPSKSTQHLPHTVQTVVEANAQLRDMMDDARSADRDILAYLLRHASFGWSGEEARLNQFGSDFVIYRGLQDPKIPFVAPRPFSELSSRIQNISAGLGRADVSPQTIETVSGKKGSQASSHCYPSSYQSRGGYRQHSKSNQYSNEPPSQYTPYQPPHHRATSESSRFQQQDYHGNRNYDRTYQQQHGSSNQHARSGQSWRSNNDQTRNYVGDQWNSAAQSPGGQYGPARGGSSFPSRGRGRGGGSNYGYRNDGSQNDRPNQSWRGGSNQQGRQHHAHG